MASRLITGTMRFSAVSAGCRSTVAGDSAMPRTFMASATDENSLPIVGKNLSATHSATTPPRGTCARCSAEAISPTRVVAIMFDANIPTQNTRRNTTIIAANDAVTSFGKAATAMLAPKTAA